MHRWTIAVVLVSLVTIPKAGFSRDTGFSQDSAYRILTTLVNDIGPRPMGSPAEQRALAFAVSKFTAYGCRPSYVMPMTVADGVNTKSGIAVGVLKGRTNRIIVIGGHMDSAGPEIPGANDDASGVACVIEIARVLAQRQHESTIVFCCWGGEEQGLKGSKYFVGNFENIDSVALMLQIDMADGASTLGMDPEAPDVKAPRWLPRAAFEIFYDQLHGSGLVYPTHSATINSALGGLSGSDHVAFLEKGIPAIDFTSDVNYPIHTAQDNLENFTPSGLKRAGDLVLSLFERFDADVPARSTERYMLLQAGHALIIADEWMLWCLTSMAIALAVVAIIFMRARRTMVDPADRVKWSGVKVLLFTAIIQIFCWTSPEIVGLLRGYRYPWVNNFSGFFVFGTLCGTLGMWVVLQMVRHLRLSRDGYGFARVAMMLFLIQMVLSGLRGPELAVFPAASMAFFALALLARRPAFKILLLAGSVLVMFRLIFFEELGLWQRLLSQVTGQSFGQSLMVTAGLVLFFTLISLPFMYAFAAVYRDAGIDILWLKKLRTRTGLVTVLVAAVGVMIYLFNVSLYDGTWKKEIRVEQRYTLGADSSMITVRGSEYLDGLSVQDAGKDSVLHGRTTFQRFRPSGRTDVSWCSVDVHEFERAGETNNDSTMILERRVEIRSQLPPLRVAMTYGSASSFDVQSSWAHGGDGRLRQESDRSKVFTWYSYPETPLVVPLTFTLKKGQTVGERIEVIYDSLAYPLTFSLPLANISRRTVVTAIDTVRSARPDLRASRD